jgi:hypothetical protein
MGNAKAGGRPEKVRRQGKRAPKKERIFSKIAKTIFSAVSGWR